MQEPESSTNKIDEQQKEFIQHMTLHAESIRGWCKAMLGNEMDYSVDSLKTLDELLEQFHQHQNDLDDKKKGNLIREAGSYVFEVARRNYGGKYYWQAQQNQPILVTGQPEFEISIIAFDKVKKRLKNGKEDYIPFYFKGYEERVVQGKSGDRALII